MEKIIKFYMNADQLEKWMYQNKACYTGYFVEGSFLDNFVLDTEIGFVFFYEDYVNCWTSRYYVEYAINRKKKPCKAWKTAFKKWYEFEEKRETQLSLLREPKEKLLFERANSF